MNDFAACRHDEPSHRARSSGQFCSKISVILGPIAYASLFATPQYIDPESLFISHRGRSQSCEIKPSKSFVYSRPAYELKGHRRDHRCDHFQPRRVAQRRERAYGRTSVTLAGLTGHTHAIPLVTCRWRNVIAQAVYPRISPLNVCEGLRVRLRSNRLSRGVLGSDKHSETLR